MERLWRLIGWRRLVVTAVCLGVWRAMLQIDIVQPPRGRLLNDGFGGIPSYSLAALGVQPYIVVLVLFTVLPAISRKVRELSRDASGRRRLQRWIRAATALVAMTSGYSYTAFLESSGVLPATDWFQRLTLMLVLTAGTMTLVLLCDAMDEFGLGFGRAAFVLYLSPYLLREAGRIGDFVRYASAFNDRAAYMPLAVWAAIFVALLVVSVVLLRAHRAIPLVASKRTVAPLVLPLVMSGVFRPSALANAIVFIPQLFVQTLAVSRPELAGWFLENWTSYGPNPLIDAAFTLLYASLIVLTSVFIVAVEYEPWLLTRRLEESRLTVDGVPAEDVPGHLEAIGSRLGFAGGVFQALFIGIVPVVAYFAMGGPNKVGPSVSGYYAFVIPALVLAIYAAVRNERRGQITFSPRLL